MTDDFRDLLSAPIDTFEAPVQPPPGVYKAIIERSEFLKSAQKGTNFVRFHLRLSEAVEVDDTETLEKVDNLSDVSTKIDFYLTKNAMFRLRNLLESAIPDAKGRSAEDLIQELNGMEMLATMANQPNKKDPANPYLNCVKLVGIDN